MQVVTFIEGKIPKARTQNFLSMCASVRNQVKPPGWKRSILLQDKDDKEVFWISTLWESGEALEQMRKNSDVPFAFQILRMHGAEPSVRIFEVPYAFEP